MYIFPQQVNWKKVVIKHTVRLRRRYCVRREVTSWNKTLQHAVPHSWLTLNCCCTTFILGSDTATFYFPLAICLASLDLPYFDVKEEHTHSATHFCIPIYHQCVFPLFIPTSISVCPSVLSSCISRAAWHPSPSSTSPCALCPIVPGRCKGGRGCVPSPLYTNRFHSSRTSSPRLLLPIRQFTSAALEAGRCWSLHRTVKRGSQDRGKVDKEGNNERVMLQQGS